MCRLLFPLSSEGATKQEPDDPKQNIRQGKQAWKDSVDLRIRQEEHGFPASVLPEKIDARRGEDDAEVDDRKDEKFIDDEGFLSLELVGGGRGERRAHRERPEDVHLDHCVGSITQSFLRRETETKEASKS